MKQVTLTKIGGRILEINVGLKSEGFTTRQSRKWDAIAKKLIDASADYDLAVEDLIEEANDLDSSPELSREDREAETRRINREIRALDESLGTEEIVVVLESEEFSFLTEIWWELKFPGDRRTRALTTAVSDALDAAVEVKIEDGRVVPVDPAEKAAPKPARQKLRPVK